MRHGDSAINAILVGGDPCNIVHFDHRTDLTIVMALDTNFLNISKSISAA